MADHINISEPDQYSEVFSLRLTIAQLEAELKLTQVYRDAAIASLDAIFTRIGRGQTSELHYRDGRVITISGTGEPTNG